jgi:hypothetical protein
MKKTTKKIISLHAYILLSGFVRKCESFIFLQKVKKKKQEKGRKGYFLSEGQVRFQWLDFCTIVESAKRRHCNEMLVQHNCVSD